MSFSRFVLSVIFVCFFVYLVFLISSCKDYPRNKSHANVPASNIREGAVLAERYCQSCHALPDPSLADSKTWEKGILPNMGPRLGIFKFNYDDYPSYRFTTNVPVNYYPSEPIIGYIEWQHIIDYYTATSPDTLPSSKPSVPIKEDSGLFTAQIPDSSYGKPVTSLIKINDHDSGHILMTSDALRRTAYFYDQQLNKTDSIVNIGSLVDVVPMQDSILVCDMGMLRPDNGRLGKIGTVKLNGQKGTDKSITILFDSLRRPGQVIAADLNQDNKTDYLVCETGYLTGSLFWMETLGNKKYSKHILRPFPGAIKAYIQDYNHDGLPDIWVLFSHGEEGIFLFTNKGNGKFDEQEILRFPPGYGSTYFELTDIDQDGYPDIIYTCGENMDYAPGLKPYHGVYIFTNDKSYHFRQTYFYPVNGCYKAIAKDFNKDGKIDIAAIAFFADYEHKPQEGFLYFENRGHLDFQPYSLPASTKGRWFTMDAGDIDGDGRPDIVLGNFSIGPGLYKPYIDWKKAPPFIVLKNTGK